MSPLQAQPSPPLFPSPVFLYRQVDFFFVQGDLIFLVGPFLPQCRICVVEKFLFYTLSLFYGTGETVRCSHFPPSFFTRHLSSRAALPPVLSFPFLLALSYYINFASFFYPDQSNPPSLLPIPSKGRRIDIFPSFSFPRFSSLTSLQHSNVSFSVIYSPCPFLFPPLISRMEQEEEGVWPPPFPPSLPPLYPSGSKVTPGDSIRLSFSFLMSPVARLESFLPSFFFSPFFSHFKRRQTFRPPPPPACGGQRPPNFPFLPPLPSSLTRNRK